MRRNILRRATALAATGVLVISPLAVGTAAGAPGLSSPSAVGFQGEGRPDGDADYRPGAVAPTDQQRSLATQRSDSVRWNRYGAPAVLTPKAELRSSAAAASDPVAVARDFLRGNNATFGVSDASINDMDVLISRPMGEGSYVMLRQRFGGVPATLDGLASFGIRDGAVVFMTSTMSPDRAAPEPATISPEAALAAAAADVGLTTDQLASNRVVLGTVPMPGAAPRAAYQVVLQSNDLVPDFTAFTSYVDARTAQVLVREDIVDHDNDNPTWNVFPGNPPNDFSSTDTRVTWCLNQKPGCERTVRSPNGPGPWDVDPATGLSTLTSVGNNAINTEKWDSLAGGTFGTRTSTPSPTRDYNYAWTNQWFNEKCNPAVFATPQQNDIDAATANLFAMHNRMHDWSYNLGFTEEAWNLQTSNGSHSALGGDAERGQSQSGGRAGGAPPAFASRDNANQSSPPDGVPPVTNMYLWQSIPGGFYAPCVDGDYDMSVIGHEYSHAITGRMIGGPNSGWSGAQAGAMNESHSDLFAMEYLYEYGFRPRGNSPYVTGGYVTGDLEHGIRNYDMSKSPLNYSDLSYDIVGQQVHADGEIWSATSFDLRQALITRYGLGTPSLQRSCADGATPITACPGNRRWVQLEFDALLLNASGAVSYVDYRNSILAADMIRFGGANQALLWNVFAQHGLGRDAASVGPNDDNATPSFASPTANNGSLRLIPVGQAAQRPVRLYVGDYEARSLPVADTDPATPLPDTVEIAPGDYTFVVAGNGFGAIRMQRTVTAGEKGILPAMLFRNLASASLGATASGDGVNLDKLIDDTEGTNWLSMGSPVAGKSVIVDLAGSTPQVIQRVQVSALLRPQIVTDPDPAGQNRFTALRQFEVLACNGAFGQDCANPANFQRVYTSPANAFPADLPRPTSSDMTFRSFKIPTTVATHLMIRVLNNQCTGGPEYAGQQHNDPRSNSDCTIGNPVVAQTVRISEFQAFNN